MGSTVPAVKENAPVTDIDTAVDRLHAVPLEDFVAERKRLAKELRAAGDRDSAAELAKLPKPSAPAWALNHVAREEPAVVGDWLDAAEALRDASSHAGRSGGDALREAIAAHRDATRRVLGTVREQARPNGRELSEPMLDRVRELLQAATADPARAELLRAGRVFEGDDDEPPPLPEPAARERGTKARGAGERGTKARGAGERGAKAGERAAKARAAEERAEREAEARAELERLVAGAEERLEELRAAADERADAAEQAGERLEEARRTLHRSESEAAAARQAAEEAAEAAEQAERELRKLSAKLSS
jgi:hypothetical protein